MPALSFQQKFIDKVIDGSKPGTVRQVRLKGAIKPYQYLSIYTGMRTKQCKKHGEKYCLNVYPIRITKNHIWINDLLLPPDLTLWFAIKDGFLSSEEFFNFFEVQNYKRDLVWIVWGKKAIAIIQQHLNFPI